MSRHYDQFCPVARVLDVVGERWTLLIVRELLLGPRRFTDLAAGLPGIGTSVLTTRLKQLEHDGLVRKQTLPAPAASVVYELTPSSLGLTAILGAMAYATYDLTNLATLRGWTLPMALADIGWGTAVTALAATAGFLGARAAS